MLLSMTGFGRGECVENGLHVTAEIRSVNNRFLDVSVRMPRILSVYEADVKELIRQHLSRGRVNLSISLQAPEMNGLAIKPDLELARSYAEMLRELSGALGLEGGVRLEHLLNFSEIFAPPEDEETAEVIWNCARKAIVQAIEELNRMRAQEGANLAKDLLARVDHLEEVIGEIEKIARQNVVQHQKMLEKRLKELLQSPELDRNRLETEMAIMADRLDITEECVRFRSHIDLFRDFVNHHEVAGRKLNFLLQEMNREANTIAAKASNADISHRVVLIKEELERLREQVQNVE
jgi:uncharacterized protein (TIGR00255 family)